jgi:DHA1 family multidrug resistance protein-like MFS transporter
MLNYRRNMLVLSITLFISNCGLNQFVPFLPLFIKELGVKDSLAFWTGTMISISMLAAALILPFWGKMADKYGAKLMPHSSDYLGNHIFFRGKLLSKFLAVDVAVAV